MKMLFINPARNKHQNKTLEQLHSFLKVRTKKAKILGLHRVHSLSFSFTRSCFCVFLFTKGRIKSCRFYTNVWGLFFFLTFLGLLFISLAIGTNVLGIFLLALLPDVFLACFHTLFSVLQHIIKVSNPCLHYLPGMVYRKHSQPMWNVTSEEYFKLMRKQLTGETNFFQLNQPTCLLTVQQSVTSLYELAAFCTSS